MNVKHEQNNDDSITKNYSLKGGARVGKSYWICWCATGGLAELSVSDEFIVLIVPWKRYRFERHTIQWIKFSKSIIGGSIRIIHTKAEYPVFINFATWHSGELSKLNSVLKEKGYLVKQKLDRQ